MWEPNRRGSSCAGRVDTLHMIAYGRGKTDVMSNVSNTLDFALLIFEDACGQSGEENEESLKKACDV